MLAMRHKRDIANLRPATLIADHSCRQSNVDFDYIMHNRL